MATRRYNYVKVHQYIWFLFGGRAIITYHHQWRKDAALRCHRQHPDHVDNDGGHDRQYPRWPSNHVFLSPRMSGDPMWFHVYFSCGDDVMGWCNKQTGQPEGSKHNLYSIIIFPASQRSNITTDTRHGIHNPGKNKNGSKSESTITKGVKRIDTLKTLLKWPG